MGRYITGGLVMDLTKEWAKTRLREIAGGLMIAGGGAWIAAHLGAAIPWIVSIALVTFSVVLFVWDLSAARGRASELAMLRRKVERLERRTKLDDIRDRRTPLEGVTFFNLKQDFEKLPTAQKMALKLICENVRVHEIMLADEMARHGFGGKEHILSTIIKPLSKTDFVDFTAEGMLSPNLVRLRDVEELVFGWKMA